MNELIKPKERYWIVSFNSNNAHIVEAESPKEIIINPVRTFNVDYRDLRYSYINLNEEARNVARERKSEIDPRFLLDPANTLNDILALPQMAGRENDRESLANSLELIRMMPEDLREERIKQYIEAQQKSEAELYESILSDLRQKQKYVPEQIRNLTWGELAFGLPQAGYVTGIKGFVSMNEALDALYYTWEDVRNDPEKAKLLREAEEFAAFVVAQHRMSKFFESAFR